MSEEEKKKPKRGGAEAIRLRGDTSALIPMTHEQKALFKRAAGIAGIPMNQFIRDAAEAAALAAVKKFKETLE